MAVFLINVFLWSTIGYCSDVSMLVARLNGLSAPPRRLPSWLQNAHRLRDRVVPVVRVGLVVSVLRPGVFFSEVPGVRVKLDQWCVRVRAG